jgi:hypothetical protein
MKVRSFMLAAAALLACAVSATGQTISESTLPGMGPRANIGLPHSRTVVSNQYGYFAVHTYESNADLTAANWRLVRSVDGGASFTQLYSGLHSTATPLLETDRDGNIYLIHSDGANNQAILLRFLVANNYTNPSSLALQDGDAQKFTAVIDERRGRLYYVAMNGDTADGGRHVVWFFNILLDGSGSSRCKLTVPGSTAEAGYPHLYVDEHDDLYAAWTTGKLDTGNYYSIRFMRSRDGAQTWERLDGTPIALPVAADESGTTHEVNLESERNHSTWLWTMIVKQGKIHFAYLEGGVTVPVGQPHPMHYVRFDIVTGARDHVITPTWGGSTFFLNSADGSCATRRERLDSTIYCVSRTLDNRLGVLVTHDNGQTWQQHAAMAPLASDRYHFGVTSARQLTEGSHLIGGYTESPRPSSTVAPIVRFFRVLVDTTTPLARFPQNTTAVSGSGEPPGYPLWAVNDNSLATFWAASTTPSPSNNSAWIQLDLGSVKEVRHVKWSTPAAHAPAHYTLMASDDGVNWTKVSDRTSGYPVENGYEPVYLNARYLKLTTTKVADGTGANALGFWEFWAEGTQPPCTARIPLNWADISSAAPGHPGGYAVDENPSTTWFASTPHAWIEVDLGSIRPITRLRWLGAAATPEEAHSPADYTISVSSDFNTWRQIKSRTNTKGIVNGEELIALTARYIVLYATKVNNGVGQPPLGLREFWAEGPAACPPNP